MVYRFERAVLEIIATSFSLVFVAQVEEDVLQGREFESLQQLGRAVLGQELSEPHHADDVGLTRLLDVVRRDHDGSPALGDLSNRNVTFY